MRPAPTLVLVHGGTVDSRIWNAVLEHLSIAAYAPDLPGRRDRPADLGSLKRQDWVDAVCDDIVAKGMSDVVMVGHSSGGYVIPGVAASLPDRMRHLVFVAATVPSEGRRPVDFLKPKLRSLAIETEKVMRDGAAGKTLGGTDPGEPRVATSLEVVENDARMGLEAPGPLFEPFTWAGFPAHVPRTYVRCIRDRVIPPDLADTMVANMGGADVVDVDAGHEVYYEEPAKLAAVLEEVARS